MMEETFERLALRCLNKEATEKEIEMVNSLVKEDENYNRKFEQLKITWKKEIFPQHQFNLDKGRQILNQKIKRKRKKESTNVTIIKLTKNQIIGFAASVAILMMSLFGVLFHQSPSHQQNYSTAQMMEKIVPSGKKQTIKLKDGTRVKINASSKFTFPEIFDKHERIVYLEGEAFFEVARDTLRPFKIITGKLTTQVLGTSFNISAYPENEEIKVSVATGKVNVSHLSDKNNKVHLIPGEQAVFSKTDSSLAENPFDFKKEFAWKDSTLLFEDTPMTLVAKTMERWYGLNVTFENQKISNCLLTGEFKNESLTNVLESIKYTNEISYRIENKTIFLNGEGCN
ncbi:MAG: DUF4974 domain-containing protein [Flammeovirgaceae bacterium]|nr:DUF4974 domain-containing protein [Flammeovirgaceae bacterium]